MRRSRRRHLRVSLATCLAGTALAALTLAVFRLFDWQTRSVWLLASLWVACGYVAGWLTHSTATTSIVAPAAGFLSFNWLLWYANGLSLSFADRSSNRLAEVLARMVAVEKLWVFDAIAAIFTGILVIAASRRDAKAVHVYGSICAAFWFIVIATGYVTASASLWQTD